MSRRKAGFSGVLLFPICAIPLPILAQDALLEPEIVVTGARTQSPLMVVSDPSKPQQPVPAHDGADYLKTISGFSVIRKGGTDGDPVFRGMAGSRITILSNEDMLLGGCGARMDPPTAYVFPQNYDQIVVLKGPQSVLYGAGGSAATVLFERDRYERDGAGNGLRASVMAGTWGRQDLAADGQFGNEHGYLRLQGSDARADDYEDGDGNAVHANYHRWNMLATAGWTPNDDMLVEVTAAKSNGEAAYADRTMDGAKFDRESLSLRFSRRNVSERVAEISGQVAYGYVDHAMDNYTLRDFMPSMMMPNPITANPDRKQVAARLMADFELTSSLTASVGFDAHEDEHRNRSSMNDSIMPYTSLARVPDANYQQQGMFAEFSYEAAPGRIVESGIRFDRWRVEDLRSSVRQGMMSIVPNDTAGAVDRDTLSSGFIRYEHGVRREVLENGPDIILFAGLGYSERTADYWERFGNDKQSLTTNSAFFAAPERTTQLDLGVMRTTWNSRLSASLFTSTIADYILIDTLVMSKPTGTVVTRPVDARTYGGEIEYSRDVAESWSFQSSMTYTHGTNGTDGGPLAQMPPLEARASLSYTGNRYSVGALMRFAADQDRVDIGRGNIVGQDIAPTDAFGVLSLNASYRVTQKANLSMGVDNLLDETYAEHLSRAGAMVSGYIQSQRINEPGRMAWLKINVEM